ncbi:MAG: efflux RND transporter periplasmic adaptor subunit [Bdellovibrionales bacterium]|nr:efflux RND transporter periplasmic adaptor subunit [Bdellovibrionales bacterium]
MNGPAKSRAKFKLIVAGGLALLGVGGWFVWSAKGRNKNKVSYSEHSLKRGDMEVTILSTGSVAPENRLEIKPPIAGRMEEVLVKEGQVVKKGQTLAWMSSTERAAVIDAARAQSADELKRWSELYKPAPILAPLDGTIILRNIEPGQSFAAQDAILVMSDRLTVKAQVDETDIAQIHLQQRANIVLDAYPGKPIAAIVDQIAYDAKTVNNVTTYVVDVLPKVPPAFMRSGMTANVTFSVEAKTGVLVAPFEAIKNRDGKSSVLVKAPDPKAEPIEKPIEIGVSDGKRVEVVSGLVEGDVILVPQMSADSLRATRNGSPFSPSFGGGGNKRR